MSAYNYNSIPKTFRARVVNNIRKHFAEKNIMEVNVPFLVPSTFKHETFWVGDTGYASVSTDDSRPFLASCVPGMGDVYSISKVSYDDVPRKSMPLNQYTQISAEFGFTTLQDLINFFIDFATKNGMSEFKIIDYKYYENWKKLNSGCQQSRYCAFAEENGGNVILIHGNNTNAIFESSTKQFTVINHIHGAFASGSMWSSKIEDVTSTFVNIEDRDQWVLDLIRCGNSPRGGFSIYLEKFLAIING